MRTTNAYARGTKKYRQLTRGTKRALRMWKKSHHTCKVIDVSRQIYRGYATIGITYIEDGCRYWTNVFC